MLIYDFVDYFIHESRFHDPRELQKSRIFVRACLLTSLFSTNYIALSLYFDFTKGVYLMAFNVLGFIVLPIFARTRISIALLGNVYIFTGASAVIILTYFSGGLWSAIYPWIISIPVLALLVVNRFSSIVWGSISFAAMIGFGLLDLQGLVLPIEYNTEMKTAWYIAILPGLLLIILFVSFVFEFTMTKALKEVESKNELLAVQNQTIANQANKLEELIEEKDYIIQILAHDLRNPLATISGLVNLIRIEQNPAGQKKYVEMINSAASNANHLVKRVLEMDASDQKDLKTELRPLHIVETIEAVIKDCLEQANKKKIQLYAHDRCANKVVLADKIYLTQVFQNLISNAIKFSPIGTSVQVILSDSNAGVQIKIIDEGPGIHPEEESKLFKKFSKLSTRPTAGESSSGLGLSLVKRYAELTGGKVWYESKSGAGATFVVEMPLISS